MGKIGLGVCTEGCSVVITGLVPVIQCFGQMDCPDEPGNDDGGDGAVSVGVRRI